MGQTTTTLSRRLIDTSAIKQLIKEQNNSTSQLPSDIRKILIEYAKIIYKKITQKNKFNWEYTLKKLKYE